MLQKLRSTYEHKAPLKEMIRYAMLSVVVYLVLLFSTQQAFAHGLQSGIFGCQVGGCGINNWHLLDAASNTMFQISLVAYSAILGLLGYFLYQKRTIFKIPQKTKNNLLMIFGIFLIIFSVDGIMLLDSTIPECKGFAGMSLFVFVSLGFDSRAITSNPDCLGSFFIQVLGGLLFVAGLGMMVYDIFHRQKNKIQDKQQKISN